MKAGRRVVVRAPRVVQRMSRQSAVGWGIDPRMVQVRWARSTEQGLTPFLAWGLAGGRG